jgi:hypothetical protein
MQSPSRERRNLFEAALGANACDVDTQGKEHMGSIELHELNLSLRPQRLCLKIYITSGNLVTSTLKWYGENASQKPKLPSARVPMDKQEGCWTQNACIMRN